MGRAIRMISPVKPKNGTQSACPVVNQLRQTKMPVTNHMTVAAMAQQYLMPIARRRRRGASGLGVL